MNKIKIEADVCPIPMPVTLIGATVEGRANFMTAAWMNRVNYRPAMFAIALSKAHHTSRGIMENKTFSVNIPGAGMAEQTDYCGLVSGRETDKSQLFEVFYGELGTAPMIVQCPCCIECKLVETTDLPTDYLFIGEVVAAYTDEQYLTNGKIDVTKINPLILTVPDNNYRTLGECTAKAWHAGKKLKQTSDP